MTPPPATVTRLSVSPRQWPDVSPGFRTARLASGSPSPRPKVPILLAHPFLHAHICDDLGDRRDVLLQEIASYLLLQNELVNHQFETTRSTPKKVN